MHAPKLKEVLHLSKEYNLIPVYREIWADTETPIRVFHHFYDEPRAFLLESVEGGMTWARYSFIGMDPFMVIKGKNGHIHIETKTGVRQGSGRPIETIRHLLRAYKSPDIKDLPRFTGGAVGFFGYDLLKYYEQLPQHRIDDLNMNDLEFMFCDSVIAFDHFRQRVIVISNMHVPKSGDEAAIEKAYLETCAKIDRLVERLKHPKFVSPLGLDSVTDDVELEGCRSNVTKEEFIRRVERAKAYIDTGEVLQVVLSQRFEIDTRIEPLLVYRVLRSLNPSPYMYVLKLDGQVIVGTSPELLVRVEGDRVLTRPIAGTRPRGMTREQDEALERELLADQKEREEHLMLVDLGREDIGKVSEIGSVRCDRLMQVERYSHVMHLVSNVSGKLRADKDGFDALLACLPAGTVSGAPKQRAMEIIAELESEARGAYAGAIAYLGFSGNIDSCITIRTIIFKDGKAYVQVGAGIVKNSVPEKEYEETVNKAKGMLKAIKLAETMLPPREQLGTVTNQDYYYSAGGSNA